MTFQDLSFFSGDGVGIFEEEKQLTM